VKIDPVTADLGTGKSHSSEAAIFMPICEYPVKDEKSWIQDLGGILDMDPVDDDEMELLRDLQSSQQDLANARELIQGEEIEQLPVEEETEQQLSSGIAMGAALPVGDQSRAGEPPRMRICFRFHLEQVAVLQREFECGTSRLSDNLIASKMDLKPEGSEVVWTQGRAR
jgi:hypothetical protein